MSGKFACQFYTKFSATLKYTHTLPRQRVYCSSRPAQPCGRYGNSTFPWQPRDHHGNTHQEVGEEEEAEPVGEHLLGHCLRSPEEQLWVGLEDCLMHHVFEESLENPGGRGRERDEGREREERERNEIAIWGDFVVCLANGTPTLPKPYTTF